MLPLLGKRERGLRVTARVSTTRKISPFLFRYGGPGLGLYRRGQIGQTAADADRNSL